MSIHKEAVSPDLMAALYAMMADDRLDAFHLVGGTALALRWGHRRSIDIDLFSATHFESEPLSEYLVQTFRMDRIETGPDTVRGFIQGIKVDLLAHVYPLISPLETIEDIRMAGLPDIAAMKLNAIANRGSKKDFWDYAALLKHFRHREMLAFFAEKYSANNLWHAEKSVLYFDDAENEPDPLDLSGNTWGTVKESIRKGCRW